jgi:hypothetical protein
MRDERTPTPAEEDTTTDSAVLGLLLDPGSERPWSREELAREIGDEIATADSLGRLDGAGLIHRLDGFVWASRAALAAARLGL